MNQESVSACCAVCNQDTNRRCSGCLKIFYCNTEHQRQDWKRHKSECVPRVSKHGSKKDKNNQCTNPGKVSQEDEKVIPNVSSEIKVKTIEPCSASETKHSKKSSKKDAKKVDSVTEIVNKNTEVPENNKNTVAKSKPELSVKRGSSTEKESETSVNSAITYEGSSEQQILSESAQQLSAVGVNAESDLIKSVDRTKQPSKMANLTNWISERNEELCHRVIRDMTQYGVCVLDNFLGKERGLSVLKEVLDIHRSGVLKAGQLVSNPGNTKAMTVRSDQITWVDGSEPTGSNIGHLITQVDSIILNANRMANNGKMGDYVINSRTKAMVACYPGHGTRYVQHVDNPNRDGRCITAIYYLNLNWDVQRCGGLLRLLPQGMNNQVADIAPIFDRMLFFWSDRRNPHEVQPSYETRYAITLWYFDAHERAEARRNFRERAQPSTSTIHHHQGTKLPPSY